MALNLNLGAYRVGQSYVTTPAKPSTLRLAKTRIYHFGAFDWGTDSTDYQMTKTTPNTQILEAVPGHVYGIKGVMYVFLSNAVESIDSIHGALGRTIQRTTDTIRANDMARGRDVDRHQRFAGPNLPIADAAVAMGVDLDNVCARDVCTKSQTTTRYRGIFALDADESVCGERACVHIRTQSYAEPRPSLQMNEQRLKNVRYCRTDGPVFRGCSENQHVKTYGDRISNVSGILGNIFAGGPEYSGFVLLSDLRKCVGSLMMGHLAHSVPKRAQKLKSRFEIVADDNGELVMDQRIDDIFLNRVYVVYAPSSGSFVLVSSIVVTFTDTAIDMRDCPALPYFYGRGNSRVPLVTNVPCVRDMDDSKLLQDDYLRKLTMDLFDRAIGVDVTNDHHTFKLDPIPFIADRWRVMAMVAIAFAHRMHFLNLRKSMVFLFDHEFERIIFQSVLMGMGAYANCASVLSYVSDHIKLRNSRMSYVLDDVSLFDMMLSCVDQLSKARDDTSMDSVGCIGAERTQVVPCLSESYLEEIKRNDDVLVFVNSNVYLPPVNPLSAHTAHIRVCTQGKNMVVR